MTAGTKLLLYAQILMGSIDPEYDLQDGPIDKKKSLFGSMFGKKSWGILQHGSAKWLVHEVI